jgi:hypothetical protein
VEAKHIVPSFLAGDIMDGRFGGPEKLLFHSALGGRCHPHCSPFRRTVKIYLHMLRNSNGLKHQSLHFPAPDSAFMNNESDQGYNSDVTVRQKFVLDMDAAGIATAAYRGRFFWEGPAARSDEQNGPTLQDIIGDSLDADYIVYPVGKASAEWKGAGADSENDEVERDGYKDAYTAKAPKAGDEEDED